MNKANKMFGEKIEKNIRYNEAIDTYYVQFNFSPTNDAHLRGFPTLEDARAYRDAINAEKLKYKLQQDLEVIRKREAEEIKKCVPYPYNVLKSAHLSELKVDSYFMDNFESIMNEICRDREVYCVELFFKEGKTLEAIGKKLGITRERIRQIIAIAVRKFSHYVYSYETKQKIERDFADRHAFREQLIEEYKKNGVITPEMEFEFGELKPGKLHDYDLSIDELDLSVRSFNCLRRAGIKSIKQLTYMTEDEIMKIRNMGKKSLREIRDKMLMLGYDFAQLSE